MKRSIVRMGYYILLLLAGLILYANYTALMGSNTSVPDVFDVLFRHYSLIVIAIPVFLLLLSLVLPSIIEPLRIIRYRSRINYGTVLVVVVVIMLIQDYLINELVFLPVTFIVSSLKMMVVGRFGKYLQYSQIVL